MLGCQDFCGYYDWTFHYVQREFGDDAVKRLWSEAIGGESQLHYLRAALQRGLRGLYETWVQTGEDECCDWTFTLDEDRNVLRWDMRKCPSKGFLLGNNLNAHTDYCDHCMGWIIPLLAKAGVQVAQHEHNHCGQCWGEMRVKGRPYAPLDLPGDIRKDPRWRRGYLDAWREDAKLPFLPQRSDAVEAAQVLEDAFRRVDRVIIIGSECAAPSIASGAAVLATGRAYATGSPTDQSIAAVLIDSPPVDLDGVADRFVRSPPDSRPLLLYTYLPDAIEVDFVSRGLPRPLPILPLLIGRGVYVHVPGQPPPSTEAFLSLLAKALNKPSAVVT